MKIKIKQEKKKKKIGKIKIILKIKNQIKNQKQK